MPRKKSCTLNIFAVPMKDWQAEMDWADAVDKAMKDGFASSNVFDHRVPGYGRFGDLTEHQLGEISGRMMRASEMYKFRAELCQSERDRRLRETA